MKEQMSREKEKVSSSFISCLYMIGPAKINHVSAIYTKLYFCQYL